MKYILVENQQIVHLGPMFWRERIFQSELDELEIEYTVSPNEGYTSIPNTTFEIFPVTTSVMPEHDGLYQQAVGPFYTYANNEATETYTLAPQDIEYTKSKLTEIVSNKRYTKEIAGVTTSVQNTNVTVDTSRDGRNIFVQKYLLMQDTDTVQWKFPECWLTLSKADLGNVIAAGASYIQSQFDWEANVSSQIWAANTSDQL